MVRPFCLHLAAPRLTVLVLALSALLMGGAGAPAEAFVAETLKLDKSEMTDLMRVQKHLNSARTIRSRFLQISSNGEYTEGEFFLQRPGKMRLVYDPPNPLMVVADGKYISYVDRELDQATTLLISMTRAQILLRETIALFGEDVIVTGFRRSPGIIRVNVVNAQEPTEGRIDLVFSDKPLELRKWLVTDAQGITTTVSLLGPLFNTELDPKLFRYNPTMFPDLDK